MQQQSWDRIKTCIPPVSVLEPDLEKFNYIFPGSEWVGFDGMAYLKYFLSIAYTQDSSRIESLNPVSPMSSFLYLRIRYGSYNYDTKYRVNNKKQDRYCK